MNGNIRIGNLFGIPFYINPSWFLVLGLVTISYGYELARFTELGGIIPWLLGLIAAILLFASVLAHELGHSFVAIAQGIKVKSITLFLFGGLASLERESKTPTGAFLVAIAGPLVSLVLSGLFFAIGANLYLPRAIGAIVSLLASINLVLALFNLIPGLPLDGGNVLKALVWQLTGNPNKGTIFASRVGQVFGWTAVTVGGLALIGIQVTPFASIWTLFIGGFLLQNAGFAAQSATVKEKLSGFTARDAIVSSSPVVASELTLREFVNDYVIGKEVSGKFLVADETGQLQGEIVVDKLKQISTSQWTEVRVGEITKPLTKMPTVNANTSLLEAIELLEKTKMQQLVVIEENGVLVGLIEKASIVSLLQKETKNQSA